MLFVPDIFALERTNGIEEIKYERILAHSN